jgi:hypothetical protein
MKVGSASTSLSEDCLYQAVSFSPSERGEPYEGGRAVMRLAFTNTGLFQGLPLPCHLVFLRQSEVSPYEVGRVSLRR